MAGTTKPVDQHGAAGDNTADTVDDADLALEGINMLLNNGFRESDELFRTHRSVVGITPHALSFSRGARGPMCSIPPMDPPQQQPPMNPQPHSPLIDWWWWWTTDCSEITWIAIIDYR